MFLYCVSYVCHRADEDLDFTLGKYLDIFYGLIIQRVRHRDSEQIPYLIDGNKVILRGHVLGDKLDGFGIDIITFQGKIWKPILDRERLSDLLFLGKTKRNQDLPYQAALIAKFSTYTTETVSRPKGTT